MRKSTLTRAIKLTGTNVAEGKRRTLTAGPITAMFDNGALRYIRYRGAEVLRGIAYLVRDKDWGTYAPAIENLKVNPELSMLYGYLAGRGSFVDLDNHRRDFLSILSRNVLRKIADQDESWEAMVPQEVAELIKQRCFFGHCR